MDEIKGVKEGQLRSIQSYIQSLAHGRTSVKVGGDGGLVSW